MRLWFWLTACLVGGCSPTPPPPTRDPRPIPILSPVVTQGVAVRSEQASHLLKKAVAAGMPSSPSQLFPPLAAEENAATALTRGYAILSRVNAAESGSPQARAIQKASVIRGAATDAARWPQLTPALVARQEAIQQFLDATQRRRLRFPIDYDAGYLAERPELDSLREFARWVCLDAIRLARLKEPGALERLAAVRRLATLLMGEQTRLDYTIGGGIFAMGGSAAIECMIADPSKAEAFAAAAVSPLPSGLEFEFVAEFVLRLGMLRNMDPTKVGSDVEIPPPTEVVREGIPQDAAAKANFAAWIDAWLPALQAVGAAGDRLEPEERLRLFADFGRRAAGDTRPEGVAHRTWASEIEMWPDLERLVATNALLVTWLAKFAQEGEPGVADLLSGKVADPFGGALRAKLEGEQLRIWSQGPDRQDDGGQTFEGADGDVTVGYPRR